MAWELLAMWAIVIVTITWFIRDEKRVRAEADVQRAARYYAHAPKYRHIAVEPAEAVAVPQRRTGGLSREQRALMETLVAKRSAQGSESPSAAQ